MRPRSLPPSGGYEPSVPFSFALRGNEVVALLCLRPMGFTPFGGTSCPKGAKPEGVKDGATKGNSKPEGNNNKVVVPFGAQT